MYRKLVYPIAFVLVMATSSAVQALEFSDDFSTPHDYISEGVSDTGWDGFVGLGAGETVDALNASVDRTGQLYIESQGARWEPNWTPLGPFLYKIVGGDFVATVKVEESVNLQWNNVGIMARVGELGLAGSGEDFECADHFLYIGQNLGRSVDNGAESEWGLAAIQPYLRLRREGNSFYHEVSSDGVSWTLLSGSPRIRADMDGLPLQVGLQQATYASNVGYVAFDDFQLTYGPPDPNAKVPYPADGARDVPQDVTLRWLAGYHAQSHDIYFGADFNDVNTADNSWPVGVSVYKGSQDASECSYTPGLLKRGKRYCWRIDEYDGTSTYKGQVWSFIVSDYLIDDFESYDNDSQLQAAWAANSSATVQLSIEPVYQGSQAMRIDYNNSPNEHCQVSFTFNSPQDWPAQNIQAVAIYFYGQTGNQPVPMYVILEDDRWAGTAVIEYEGDSSDLQKEQWQRWDINLQQLAENNPGFNLSGITNFTVCLGDRANPAVANGTVYIDHIQLHQPRCMGQEEVRTDFNGDCQVDIKDLQVLAYEWLSSGGVETDTTGDDDVDFEDYAVFGLEWLGEYELWPQGSPAVMMLKAVAFDDVNITGGLWKQRQDINRDVTIWHVFEQCENTGRIDNFRKAAGLMGGSFEGTYFNDSDVHKAIEAAAYSLRKHPDPNLEAYMDSIIDAMELAQWEDGYLYTFYSIPHQPELRWTNIGAMHELYCAGHFFEAAVAYYQTTGKSKILDVATRFADHIDSVFGPGKNMYPPGHQEVELALVKLYHQTGEQRYFDLAKFFIDQRGNAAGHSLYGTYSQDHIPVIEQQEAVGHAVRAQYMFSGMCDIFMVNNDMNYVAAMERILEDIVLCKQYVTGGIGQPGGPEGFAAPYSLDNAGAYCETCSGISNAMWNHQMFLIEGDAKYSDIAERVIYNGALSGIALTGDRYFYTNPLAANGHQRSSWFGCACCPPNLARFIASIGNYLYAKADGAIYVNIYAEGNANIDLDDNAVQLIQTTNYPWGGDVTITVTPSQPGEFTIYLRIPGWARNQAMPSDLYRFVNNDPEPVTIAINGQPIAIELQKGFAKITRSWQGGDVIELHLPMPIRRVIANPNVAADRGLVALQRGPVVYCAEWPDFETGHFSHLVIGDDANLTAEYRSNLLNVTEPVTEGVAITGTVKGAYLLPDEQIELRDESFAAIPFYAWAHRGPGPMAVWLARDANYAAAIGPTIKEMKGYWKLDETSGTTAADSSGNGNDGTCQNGLSFDTGSVGGAFGNALSFDGIDDYIDVADGFDNFGGGCTVSAWAYPTAVKRWSRFVDFGNGTASDNIVFGRLDASNDLFFEVYTGGSSGGKVTASGAIELNKWQMFTATVDANGTTKLYKNGQLIQTGKNACPQNVTRTENYIGRSNWGWDEYFAGYMDEVRIYSYALDGNGVEALYIGGRAENPNPLDDTNDVPISIELSWVAGASAAEHDVYLGTDANSVASATPGSPEHKSRQSETIYLPSPALQPATEYFWRIDEVTSSEVIIPGAVWNFTTAE